MSILDPEHGRPLQASAANLLPGNAPNTARVFSCLEAMWELRNARSCERKELRVSGKVFAGGGWEERCHCDGDRSTITDRCDGLSVATACAGAELMEIKVAV